MTRDREPRAWANSLFDSRSETSTSAAASLVIASTIVFASPVRCRNVRLIMRRRLLTDMVRSRTCWVASGTTAWSLCAVPARVRTASPARPASVGCRPRPRWNRSAWPGAGSDALESLSR
jgi:hypothetical protein